MSQSEVIELLEKSGEALSVGEIARLLDGNQKKVSKDINRMLQYNEVEAFEIDKDTAWKKYKCKHRMKIYKAKGMFLAVVDLATEKIFGCDKYSKVWWHEKGHIKFNNTDWGSRVSYWQIFFMMIAVFFTGLGVVTGNFSIQIFGFINALGMLLSYIIEEVWCWVWGLRQYNSSK